ncbi:hypothetical protein GCM10012275_12090 [Longimycelium tulufanense]|uniref:Uncharacterized protein n=1 Tax=Longimycelium tulufanense TaxID=907463 RepID=A0A8J3CD77_9PSEU|nr:hypothetical protein [Longimycelium tulufanense]GGM42729.1 hypothetical protein GCM10012275_12090 [Longimycelium tulufanense]
MTDIAPLRIERRDGSIVQIAPLPPGTLSLGAQGVLMTLVNRSDDLSPVTAQGLLAPDAVLEEVEEVQAWLRELVDLGHVQHLGNDTYRVNPRLLTIVVPPLPADASPGDDTTPDGVDGALQRRQIAEDPDDQDWGPLVDCAPRR